MDEMIFLKASLIVCKVYLQKYHHYCKSRNGSTIYVKVSHLFLQILSQIRRFRQIQTQNAQFVLKCIILKNFVFLFIRSGGGRLLKGQLCQECPLSIFSFVIFRVGNQHQPLKRLFFVFCFTSSCPGLSKVFITVFCMRFLMIANVPHNKHVN